MKWKLRNLIIAAGCFGGNLWQGVQAQPGYHLNWLSQLEHHGTVYGNMSKMVSDRSHNYYAVVSVTDSILVSGKQFRKKDGVGGMILGFNTRGGIRFAIPLHSTHINGLMAAPWLQQNRIFVFACNYSDFLELKGDTFHGGGSALVGIDTNGDVAYFRNVPGPYYGLTVSTSGDIVMKARVQSPGNYWSTSFAAGSFCVEVNASGGMTRKTYLGANTDFNAIGDCQATDSFVYFVGNAVKDQPFKGKDFEIRALDSLTHPGSYASDIFLACLYKNGNLKWLLRIDSMCGGPGADQLAIDSLGGIFWAPHYYKSGVVFGNKLYVKFRGGSYPVLMRLDPKNGLPGVSYFVDSVAGGNGNSMRIFPVLRGNTILALASGAESYHKWKNIPDSAGNIYSNALISFNTAGNYYHFAEVSYTVGFLPDYYRANYFTANAAMATSNPAVIIMDTLVTNKGGLDYVYGSFTTEKVNFSALRSPASLDFNVFPNPVSDMLFIQSAGVAEVHVFDMQGQLCRVLPVDNQMVSLTGLDNGLYSVSGKNRNGQWTKPAIIVLVH